MSSDSTPTAFASHTLSNVLGGIVFRKELVTCNLTDTLKDTLDKMRAASVTSLPVMDQNGDAVRIVDLQDVLTYLALRSEDSTPPEELQVHHLVGMGAESRDMFIFKHNDTVDTLLPIFSAGVHRVIVTLDDDLKNPQLLSQTDLIRYLNKQIRLPEEVAESTLEDAGLLRETVKAQDTESALQALSRMRNKEVTCVGIVNSSQQLVANLSCTDLRRVCIGGNNGNDELVDIEDLKNLNVLAFLRRSSGGSAPLTLTPNSTVQEALDLVVQKRIKRVWLVDNAIKPVGLCTLSDLINLCLKSSADAF
ncbi:MAG: hypothetical protein MHM6MM_000306 [Cercozoa sp. M6MM]